MRLPWKLPDPPNAAASEWADLWWPFAHGRTVLVIDEHPPYRAYLETLLHRAGYAVITISRGEEAVQTVRDAKPDVIVMDQKLPRLHGFRVLDQLQRDPVTAKLPVIMVPLRKPGSFEWRSGDEAVGQIPGDPDSLVELLRRLDLAAFHRREAVATAPSNRAELLLSPRSAGGRPRRILIADDERSVVRFMETALRAAEFEVIASYDFQELVARSKVKGFDLIAFDMMMPFGHWLPMFSELKANPATAPIPQVLIASKHPGVWPSLWIPPSGSAATFLTKPFTANDLQLAVGTALTDPALRQRKAGQ